MYKTGICGRYVKAPGFVDEYTFRGRGGQVLEPFFELAHLFQELGFSSPLDAHRRGGIRDPSISEPKREFPRRRPEIQETEAASRRSFDS